MFYRSCVVNYCAHGTFTNEYNNIYILVLHSSNTKMVSICLHESYEVIRQDEQTTAMQTIVFELCSLDSGTYN
ncbi:unnamed protein product [Sphagnum jensenii]|uniref:Uncharacterized protein n=1 Tax=Sphagnum jensenii TaxID=128206 RepID=A0ABP1BYC0_9BRYO